MRVCKQRGKVNQLVEGAKREEIVMSLRLDAGANEVITRRGHTEFTGVLGNEVLHYRGTWRLCFTLNAVRLKSQHLKNSLNNETLIIRHQYRQ